MLMGGEVTQFAARDASIEPLRPGASTCLVIIADLLRAPLNLFIPWKELYISSVWMWATH